MRSSRYRLAALGLAAFLAGGYGGRPAAGAEKPPSFVGKMDVVEVEVPVHVIGKDGEPVRGLKAESFRIFDDTGERSLSSFEAVDFSLANLESGGPGRPIRLVPGASRRHLLFLFDLTFSSPGTISRARHAAREIALAKLAPEDLAAVAVYSVERGPRLLVTFTSDRSQIARALDSLTFDAKGEGPGSLDPLRFLLIPPVEMASQATTLRQGEASEVRAELEQVQTENTKILARVAEREGKQYERSRITAWTRDLGALARSLDSVRGRKEIVLFTEGFDSRLVLGRSDLSDPDEHEDSQNALDGEFWQVDLDNRFGNTGMQGEMRRMIEQLRRADCVIEAVDIAGLHATAEMSSTTRDVGRDALFYVANESGGSLFEKENDLARDLQTMLTRTEVTYVLRFTAQGLKADGAYHRLRVEVDAPRGSRVSTRDGYYAPRPFPEVHPFERSLLAADAIAAAEPRSELPLEVLAAPFPSGDRAYVPVILEAAGRPISELGSVSQRVELELYAYATNDHGEMKDFFARTFSLDLAKVGKALANGGLKYYGHLDLAPGSYLLRVLLRERGSGKIGVATASLSVPDFATGPSVLLPPFVVDRAARWLLVRENQATAGNGTVVYPFTIEGEPYIPAAHAEVGGDGARVSLVGYNLPRGELDVAVELLGGDGRAVGEPRLAVSRSHTGITGLDKWIATLSTLGLPSGEYRLRLRVHEKGSDLMLASEAPIRIVG